jgi:hypothetical protein
VDIPVEEGSKETVQMKVWARRVWTLELSLVSFEAEYDIARNRLLRVSAPFSSNWTMLFVHKSWVVLPVPRLTRDRINSRIRGHIPFDSFSPRQFRLLSICEASSLSPIHVLVINHRPTILTTGSRATLVGHHTFSNISMFSSGFILRLAFAISSSIARTRI